MTKLLVPATLLALLAACGDDPTALPDEDAAPPDDVPVASVEVTAPTTSLDPGATLQLSAVALDSDGVELTDRPILWTSSDDDVAIVSATGLVTAQAAGPVVVTATSEGVAGEVTLTVRALPAVVASIELDPAALTLTPGQTRQIAAIVRDADGAVIEGRTVTWSSNAGLVAEVSDSGEVTALTQGTATITADCEGHEAQLTVTVDPPPAPVASVDFDIGAAIGLSPGDTQQVSANPRDEFGAVLSGRTVSWRSNASDIASVSDAGLVTAHADGDAIITAEVEGVTAALEVTVRTVDSIALNRSDAVIVADETLQLTAQPRDAAGQPIDRPVTWSSDHPEFVTVDATGLITGVAEGGALITATSGGVQAEVQIFVSRWVEYPLVSVGDDPLPAPMVEYTATIDGAERTVRFHASMGKLRIRGIDQQWTIQVTGITVVEGQTPGLYGYFDGGGFVSTGTGYELQPVGLGAPLPATFRDDGGMTVVWQPDGRSAPATLIFGAPAE